MSWNRGDDNGPKNWDLVPDPPRTPAMDAVRADGPPIMVTQRAHHDPKIHCRIDDFCPSCTLRRQELSKDRAMCVRCSDAGKHFPVVIKDGIITCTNTECENSR